MEEFVTEEEEPWYDQQDLEQGKTQDIILPTHSITTVRPVNQPPLNKGCLSYTDTTQVQTSAAI